MSTVARGRACVKCGADEWYCRSDGTISGCRPCAVAYQARLRAARPEAHRQRVRNWFKVYGLAYRRKHPERLLWTRAKHRAKRRGLTFTITHEDIRRVWPQDGRCPILGMLLELGGSKINSPSLDRIDNMCGYEPGNIAVISYRANELKSDACLAEIEALAAWMRREGA